MRKIFSSSRLAVVASSLALLLALGGTAYAAATVTGAQIVDNSVAGRDVRNGSLTAIDTAPGVLPRFARVEGGSIAAKRGGISVSTSALGVYDFSFTRSIANCAYTATAQSTFADTAVVGQVTASSLQVKVFDTQSNSLIANPFSVVVTC